MFRFFTMLLVACFLSGFALADEAPRKIDFAKILTGLDGPLIECSKVDTKANPPKCTEEVPLTLGRLCIAAAAKGDPAANAVDQVAHGRLANKLSEVISRQGTQDEALSADDITFLKIAISKLGYNTMAVYQAVKMLDPTVDK